eukprot:481328-Rhodomonas_salina.1
MIGDFLSVISFWYAGGSACFESGGRHAISCSNGLNGTVPSAAPTTAPSVPHSPLRLTRSTRTSVLDWCNHPTLTSVPG